MVGEEARVTSLENVDFGIVEFGILMHVEMTIAIAKVKCPVNM